MELFLESLFIAAALMLVIEGIMPFLSPKTFRRALLQMLNMNDQQLRSVGFFSMLLGIVILYWVH